MCMGVSDQLAKCRMQVSVLDPAAKSFLMFERNPNAYYMPEPEPMDNAFVTNRVMVRDLLRRIASKLQCTHLSLP